MVNAAAGNLSWSFTANHTVLMPVLDEAGRVLFGTGFGNRLYAVDAQTHGELWYSAANHVVDASPAVGADGTLYYGSRDGLLRALNPTNGAVKWQFNAGRWLITQPIVADDGTVYFGQCTHFYIDNSFFAVKNGVELWRNPIGYSVTGIAANETTLYVGTWDTTGAQAKKGSLVALARDDGRTLWTFLTPGSTFGGAALGADGTIYFGSVGGEVYGLYPNGQQRWKTILGGDANSSPAVGADGRVYLGCNNGSLYCLDGATGEILWTYATGASFYAASPIIGPDGVLYFGNSAGKLFALSVPGLTGPADSPWPMMGRDVRHTSRAASAVLPVVSPNIVSQPQSQTVDAGVTVILTASATGTEPLTYQWRKNGVDLTDGGTVSGATSATLNLATVQESSEGSYDVVVANSAGTVTSSAAALTVNAVDITTGLQLYMPFSGSFTDESSYARTVTPNGDAAFGPDLAGNANSACQLSGTGFINGAYTYSGYSSFTIATWVWVDPTATGPLMIVETGCERLNYTPSTHVFRLELEQDRVGGTSVFAATEYIWEFTSDIVGKWSHLALVVLPDNTAKFYLDGQEISMGTRTSDTHSWNFNYFDIGSGEGVSSAGSPWERGSWFKGKMDEVRIYDRALTAAEVRATMAVEAAPPTLTEQIVFSASATAGGQSDIYVVMPDGTGLVNLTGDFSSPAWNPRISPDGQRIAFAATGSGAEIWVMNADGSGKFKVPLAAEPYGPVFADWLDTDTLLFYSGPAAGTGLLRAVGVDGSNNRVLVNNPLLGNNNVGVDARYSATANQIVLLAQTGSWSPTYDLYLANADGSNPRVFFADPDDNTMDRHPIWSRDGQTLYWSRPGGTGVNHNFGIVRRALNSANPNSAYDAVVWPYAGVVAVPQATSPDNGSLLLSLGDGRLVLLNLTSGANQTVVQFASMGDADWGKLGGGTPQNHAPTITCPQSGSVECGGATGSLVEVQANVTDPDTGTLTISLKEVVATVTTVLGTKTVSSPAANQQVIFEPFQFAPGAHQLLVEVNDGSETASCASSLTIVQDTQPPTVTPPTAIAVTTDAGQCHATSVALGTPATTDDCGVSSVVNNAPTVFLKGNTTVTWTVTDVNGNSASATQTVTVNDTQSPTITAPANVTVSTDAGKNYASNVPLGTPATADNCGVASAVSDAPAMFPLGATTVTWVVIDTSGNSATATQTVTVNDTEPPTIIAPPDVVVNTDPGTSGSGTGLTPPVTTDNSGIASVTSNAPSTFPFGTTIVTWTVTDTSGNVSTITQTVTVRDTEKPSIAPPQAPAPVSVTAGLCSASGVNLGTPIIADNCGSAGLTLINDAPAVFPKGITIVTWTVTDTSGNTATATQQVTVVDAEKPTISAPPPVTVNTDPGQNHASVVALGIPTTADNCSVASVVNNAPVTFAQGTTTIIWTVTDSSGNTATATQTVTVIDAEPPAITCPGNIAVANDAGVCGAIVAYVAPVGTDNCPGSVTVQTAGLVSGAMFPVGTTVNTFQVTDAAGKTASCSFTVTVNDKELPIVNCPGDIERETKPGECQATIAVTPATATDNCVATVIGLRSDGQALDGAYPKGVTTITWTATDAAGNVSTATQTVTVEDKENPTLVAPAGVTVNTDPGECQASGVALGTPTTADNCAVASVTSDAPAVFPKGETTVTWTVTDTSGNTATATQTVTVNDNEKPTIASPADLVIVSDRAACAADDHDDDDWNRHSRYGRHRDEGEDHGSCRENHGRDDNDAHGYTCRFWNRCRATGVTLTPPVVTDNCAVASVVNNHPSTTYPLGVTLVTWTVTDSSGNVSTSVQKVIVVASVEVSFRAPVVRKPTCNTIRRGQVVPFKVELENCLDQTIRSGVTVKLQVQGIDAITGTIFQDVIEDASGMGTDGTVTSDGLMQLRNSQWQFNLDTGNFGDPNTVSGSRYYRATVTVIDNATLAVLGMGTVNLETGRR